MVYTRKAITRDAEDNRPVGLADADEKTAVLDQSHAETDLPPPYKVLLHNDDVNDMEYVVETIARLTPLTVEQAVRKMMEAHRKGLTLLLVCHKERAELYREQFKSCRLTVTIEPE